MPTPLQALKRFGIIPKRRRGQNFLIDKNIALKIITRADPQPLETVVEIGSGSGVLTEQLVKTAGKVYAIEIDKELIPALCDLQENHENMEIIQQDIRAIPNTLFGADFSYRVIANIPYNITSLLIRKFLEEEPRPSDMILMVQLEVAKRMCAEPPRMNLLAAMTQYYAKPRLLFKVSRSCFYPKPKVDSAVVRIELDRGRNPKSEHAKRYTAWVKAGYCSPRKLLASNLSKGLDIPREYIRTAFDGCGIRPESRAQELSVEAWKCLIHEALDP
ncbi:ribosomal RNA small subunit methyltransferase A [Candidatus Uhrbacteria bacterium]|nr:ribosomal RNA small subunit methyltransferase A [Candidatus Uhrbacteria bacterium]